MGLLTEPQANFTTQIDTAALLVTLQNASQYTYPDSLDGALPKDFGMATLQKPCYILTSLSPSRHQSKHTIRSKPTFGHLPLSNHQPTKPNFAVW